MLAILLRHKQKLLAITFVWKGFACSGEKRARIYVAMKTKLKFNEKLTLCSEYV
jgi:hypothetical protein